MIEHPKLYKRNTDGSIQVWWIQQAGEEFRTISGQLNGKMVEAAWRTSNPTNVGKANERDKLAQANFEIQSTYKKKTELNYTYDVNMVDKTNFFQCMLAKDFLKDKKIKKVTNTLFSQPKLDGIRCIITVDGAFSRTGKEIVAVPHILEKLRPIFTEFPDLILDGELYNHLYKDNFNEIISMVRQSKPTQEDLEKSAQYIQYWVYDIVNDDPYTLRHSKLIELFLNTDETIQVIPNTVLVDHDHLMELYESYVELGYEGQMIRVDGIGYENKRTSNLLKHKSFDDSEFEIVSIEEGTGNRAGMAGYVICRLPDGRTFSAGAMGTFEECIKMYEERDEYVGGQVTVQHFRLTPDGVPRFPKAKVLFKGKRDF